MSDSGEAGQPSDRLVELEGAAAGTSDATGDLTVTGPTGGRQIDGEIAVTLNPDIAEGEGSVTAPVETVTARADVPEASASVSGGPLLETVRPRLTVPGGPVGPTGPTGTGASGSRAGPGGAPGPSGPDLSGTLDAATQAALMQVVPEALMVEVEVVIRVADVAVQELRFRAESLREAHAAIAVLVAEFGSSKPRRGTVATALMVLNALAAADGLIDLCERATRLLAHLL